mmetsp:Transcript_18752/g.27793  ORF Transcript_18752/g.27793 Transcript_18752/m.27793 type:complete len:506 (-) Transcript_18752:315-1832(-)
MRLVSSYCFLFSLLAITQPIESSVSSALFAGDEEHDSQNAQLENENVPNSYDEIIQNYRELWHHRGRPDKRPDERHHKRHYKEGESKEYNPYFYYDKNDSRSRKYSDYERLYSGREFRKDEYDKRRKKRSNQRPERAQCMEMGGFDEAYKDNVPVEEVAFTKGAVVSSETTENIYPLSMKDFPISDKLAKIMRKANFISVTTQSSAGVVFDLEKLMNFVKSFVHLPEDRRYWQELNYVIDLQKYRKQNKSADILMPLPNHWKGYSLEDAAQAVHNEYPAQHQATYISELISSGVKIDKNIISDTSKVDFINTIVLASALNTWSFQAVAPNTFAMKYAFGMPRPEEMVYRIYKGEYGRADGVPRSTLKRIQNLDLGCMEQFTAYPEGCPNHGSFPAMHSSGSTCSMWLPIIFDLTPEQLYNAKVVDYAVAQARSAAGVHYAMDNIAGLSVGQDMIAKLLPHYLEERYGSDPEYIKRKIEKYRFSWYKFHKKVEESREYYAMAALEE